MHTFIVIFFRRGSEAIRVAFVVVVAIWLYIILFVAIAASVHTKGNERYINPTPYWCWINANFRSERIIGEYFWMWFTAFFSLSLYIPLFFCLRGNLAADQKKWWIIRWRKISDIHQSQGSKLARNAFVMLLYPALYIVLVLPDSICRWIGFENIPAAATFSCTSIFGLSGLVNVCLLLYTRPGLLLLSETQGELYPAHRPIFGSSESVASSGQERRQDSGHQMSGGMTRGGINEN